MTDMKRHLSVSLLAISSIVSCAFNVNAQESNDKVEGISVENSQNVFDGQPHKLTITKTEAAEGVELSYSLLGENGFENAAENPEFIEAGTYNLQVRATKEGLDTLILNGSVTIDKRPVSITAEPNKCVMAFLCDYLRIPLEERHQATEHIGQLQRNQEKPVEDFAPLLSPLERPEYLHYRGMSDKTINDPLFQGKVGNVNGIASFSMWWVIAHDLLQRYFAEGDFLKLHYPRIVARMDEMETHCDERGFLTKNLGWNFMDWTDDAGGKVRSEVSLQCIYYWALQSAVHLATLSDDAQHAQAWSGRAAKLRANIRRAGMDGTRHARILAIVSGAYEGPDAEKLARELAEGDFEPTKTPYMATFEVMALARGGQMKAAWRKFESVWGAMYDAGERTCWEWWDPSKSGDARYLFYRRPFGNALCHQWSSGVVHLLSSVLK